MQLEPLEQRSLLSASDVSVRFEFRTLDDSAIVSSLSVGQDYLLKAYVQDSRATPAGVAHAYFDINYSAAITVNGAITHGTLFNASASGDTNTAGLLNDIGGADTDTTAPAPPGTEELLFSVPVHAAGAGLATITAHLADITDPLVLFDSATAIPEEQVAFSVTNGTNNSLDAVDGPTVVSAVRADANPTNAATVDFTVTFSESVSNVDISDFVVSQDSIGDASVVSVSGSGTTYTVTVNTGTGDGIVGLVVVDNDSIVDATDRKLGGEGTGNGQFAGEAYTVDKTFPTKISILRADPNPSNASVVHFTITFSEAVIGVGTSDFLLAAGSGLTGTAVTEVSGSGTTYTVTVNTGTGSGTLRLDLVDDDSITDLAGNPLGGAGSATLTGATYVIDRTAPAVVSILGTDTNPTNADTVHFVVTFDQNVTGVDVDDFTLVATGSLAGYSIASVTGSGTTYTVTVNTGSGAGTLRLDLADNDTIKDPAGNPLGGEGTQNVTGSLYTVDREAPAVQSIVRADANPAEPGSVVRFTVTFSESVTGVTAEDFALAVTGGVTGAAITLLEGSGATYTVTVNTGSGTGTVGLNLVDDDSIADPRGNKLGGTGTGNGDFTGQLYSVETLAPVVLSINRVESSPTNSGSVHFTVTFSKDVSNVGTDDFALALTGTLAGAQITNVSGNGAVYIVTVTTGTGDGTLGLNLVDNDTIVDGGNTPLGGEGIGNGDLTGQTFSIDRTAPTVSSIVRASTNPTGATSVQFTVTFSEDVSNVSTEDFILAVSGGVTGAAITSVSGSGSSYTVTVSTGAGDGTLGLNLVDDNSITDGAGNALGGPALGDGNLTGEAYTIDHFATVISIVRVGSATVNGGNVNFTVTFSEAVTQVTADDFALAVTGTISGASIVDVTGNGTTYNVQVNTGSGEGTIGLNLVDNDSILDAGENPLGGTGAGNGNFTGTELFTVDRAFPTVVSIDRAQASPTNAGSVTFTVTFSEAVTGVGIDDFALAATGVSGATITDLSGTGTTYTITVSTGTGDGTLGLNLVDDDTITDAAGNKLGGTETGNGNFTGQLYTIDKTHPNVVSIVRADTNPTGASSVTFTVTFDESVTGVEASDFALAASGVTGAQITNVAGSGTTYTVTVSTGSGDGTLGLNLVDDDTIADAAGNKLGGTEAGNGNFTGQVYTVDKAVPTVVSIVRAGTNPTNAATVTFTVTFSEEVTGVNVSDFVLAAGGTLANASITNVTGSGTTYTVTVGTGTGNGSLGLNLVDDDSIQSSDEDKLGGTGAGNGNFTGEAYTIDRTSPSVTSITRLDPVTNNLSSVRFQVVFSEEVTGVNIADFVIAKTNAVAGDSIVSVSGSGTTYTVTVNTGSGDGTLGLNLNDDDSITDTAGNPLGGTGADNGDFTGEIYTIDKSPPTVSNILLGSANPTTASTVSFTVNFGASVTGVDQSDFTLTTTGAITGAAITSISGSGSTYFVTVSTGSGDGTIGLNLVDNDSIVDDAGNKLGGEGAGNGNLSSALVYTVDRGSPTVTSINRADTSPTTSGTVRYTVVFSENVTNVDTADFSVVTSGGVTGASVASVSGSGNTYTVTVNTGTGSGTVGLNLVDNDGILDPAGNHLGGTGTGNGNFTGQTYTVNRTAGLSGIVFADLNVNGTQDSGEDGLGGILITLDGFDNQNNRLPTQTVLTNADGSYAFASLVSGTYSITETQPTMFGFGTAKAGTLGGSGNGNVITGISFDTNTSGTGYNFADQLPPARITIDLFLASSGSFSEYLDHLAATSSLPGPYVTSMTKLDADPTSASSVRYSLSFNRDVTGVDVTDFLMNAGSGISSGSVASVSGSGSNYVVTINTGSNDGFLQFGLIDDDTVRDSSNRPLGGNGSSNGNYYSPRYTVTHPTASTAAALADAAMAEDDTLDEGEGDEAEE